MDGQLKRNWVYIFSNVFSQVSNGFIIIDKAQLELYMLIKMVIL